MSGASLTSARTRDSARSRWSAPSTPDWHASLAIRRGRDRPDRPSRRRARSRFHGSRPRYARLVTSRFGFLVLLGLSPSSRTALTMPSPRTSQVSPRNRIETAHPSAPSPQPSTTPATDRPKGETVRLHRGSSRLSRAKLGAQLLHAVPELSGIPCGKSAVCSRAENSDLRRIARQSSRRGTSLLASRNDWARLPTPILHRHDLMWGSAPWVHEGSDLAHGVSHDRRRCDHPAAHRQRHADASTSATNGGKTTAARDSAQRRPQRPFSPVPGAISIRAEGFSPRSSPRAAPASARPDAPPRRSDPVEGAYADRR